MNHIIWKDMATELFLCLHQDSGIHYRIILEIENLLRFLKHVWKPIFFSQAYPIF